MRGALRVGILLQPCRTTSAACAPISEQTPHTFVGAGRSLFGRRELLRGRFNVCPANRGEA